METYDTHDEITEAIARGLTGLFELLDKRRAAVLSGRALSGWFIERGKMWLSPKGELLRVFPARRHLADDAIWRDSSDPHLLFDCKPLPTFPDPAAICEHCLEPWTVETLHLARHCYVANRPTWQHRGCLNARSFVSYTDAYRRAIADAAKLAPPEVRWIFEPMVAATRIIPAPPLAMDEEKARPPRCVIETQWGPIKVGLLRQVFEIDWSRAKRMRYIFADGVDPNGHNHLRRDHVVHRSDLLSVSGFLCKLVLAALAQACSHCKRPLPTHDEISAVHSGTAEADLDLCWGEPDCTDRVAARAKEQA